MREANDLKISAAIRRELSSRRVDLSKIKFPVKAGEVTLQGELSFVGLEKTADEAAIELKFIETSINGIEGVSKLTFELTNWNKNESGIWESKSGVASSSARLMAGEGLVCPECDYVIRFCPCCGKPLVPGAKPGMHKGSLSKVTRKPNLPPIKPIARKPRPLGITPVSPISNPTVKPITPISIEKTEAKTVAAAPATTPVEEVKATVNEVNTENKTVAPPKPLRPLKPLKPLGGISRHTTPVAPQSVIEEKPHTEPVKEEPVAAPAPIGKPPVAENTMIGSAPVFETASEAISTPERVPMSETQQSVPDFSAAFSSPLTEPQQQVQAESFTDTTPIPDFMKAGEQLAPQAPVSEYNAAPQASNISNIANLSIGGLGLSPETSTQPQVPDIGNLSIGGLGSAPEAPIQPQVPDIGNLSIGGLGSTTEASIQPQVPDLGSLDFGLERPGAQEPTTPNLDLGMNLDLGLGAPSTPLQESNPTQAQMPDLGMELGLGGPSSQANIPDLNLDFGLNMNETPTQPSAPSMNLGPGSANTANGVPDFNLGGVEDLGLSSLSSIGSAPASQLEPQPISGLSFDNLGDDDTPLPPMRPAQPQAAPKPAPKKSKDIFASLFEDNGSGNDGMNLDDLQVIPSGEDNPLASSGNQSIGLPSDDGSFNLGNVFDLDAAVPATKPAGAKKGTAKPSAKAPANDTPATNIFDLDLDNFKL